MFPCDNSRIVVFGQHDSLFNNRADHKGGGVSEVTSRRSFYTILRNPFQRIVDIPKGTVITSTVNVRDLITDVSGCLDDAVNNTSSTVNAIPLQLKNEKHNTGMTRPFEAKREDNANETIDKGTLRNINEAYSEYRREFVLMVQKYETICDGHIQRIDVENHRIDLVGKNKARSHAHSYRVVSKGKKLEKIQSEKHAQ